MKHFEHLECHIPNLLGLNMLDIGSGRGKFLIDVTKRSGTIIGLEKYDEYIDKAYIQANNEGVSINVLQGEAEQLPFKDRLFGFINISEVIEHVESPEMLLGETFRVLKEDGYVYLSVPNRFSLKDTHFKLYFIIFFPRTCAEYIITFLNLHKYYSGNAVRHRLKSIHNYTFSSINILV